MKAVLFGVLREIGAHLPVGVHLTKRAGYWIQGKVQWSENAEPEFYTMPFVT